jgi:uncharacterized protein
MKVEFNPAKRELALSEHGLDFCDAPEIFDGRERTSPDLRFDYPEPRNLTYGFLRGRLVAVVWTEIEDGIRVISMRKANEREQDSFRRGMD